MGMMQCMQVPELPLQLWIGQIPVLACFGHVFYGEKMTSFDGSRKDYRSAASNPKWCEKLVFAAYGGSPF
jgi:hypothetical protein